MSSRVWSAPSSSGQRSQPAPLLATSKVLLAFLVFVGLVFVLGMGLQFLYLSYSRATATSMSPRHLAAMLHWPQRAPPPWAPPPHQDATCLYTKLEPFIVADSNGRVCTRDNQAANGCCAVHLDVQPCQQGCSSTWGCCCRHSLCVSCCLSRSADDSPNTFQLCSYQCQFTSLSTVSGNRFRHGLKYCYTSSPETTPSSASTTMILTELGDSCSSACGKLSLGCEETFLEMINSCDSFPSKLACGSRCKTRDSREFPGVDRQGGCLLASHPHLVDCHSWHPDVRRLCNCLGDDINPDRIRFDHRLYLSAT